MSRIGRKPINIPAGVEVKLDGNVITVKGAKGTLTQKIHPNMTVSIEDGVITVTRPNDDKENRSCLLYTSCYPVGQTGSWLQD